MQTIMAVFPLSQQP